MKKLTGGCLCGRVRFEVEDDFERFHLCHCLQCRKITGSAHASNLFIRPDKLAVLSGIELIKHYTVPDRDFSKCFCSECGSGLPHPSKSGDWTVVPAGSLDEAPTLKPQDNIFWADRADWYEDGVAAEHHEGFPP